MVEPTQRQLDVLAFIDTYIAANGWAPTIREMGAGLGMTSNAAITQHLKALEKKGCIVREFGSSRAMRITLVGKAWCTRHKAEQNMEVPE